MMMGGPSDEQGGGTGLLDGDGPDMIVITLDGQLMCATHHDD